MKVAEIMTRHVEFVAPAASVQDAATLMGELDVGALPVGSAENLVGVVTDRDILYRVVAEGRDPKRVRIGAVATKIVFSCRAEDALTTALEVMASHNIRRLPVMENDRVVGWLTLSDLSRRLLVDSDMVQSGLRELTEGLTPGRDDGHATEKDASTT